MWRIPHVSERGQHVLIAHDFAYQYGGAERVTQAIGEAFPDAQVLVIGGHRHVLARMGIAGRTISVLPLGRLSRDYRSLAPLFPHLLARCHADLVVSSSYAFAHHVRAQGVHVEYCHSPLRQIWIAPGRYEKAVGPTMRLGMNMFDGWLKKMDLEAVAHVDYMVATCENVRARIKAIYGRDAPILYPPVRTDAFFPTSNTRERGLCLTVARLVEPYKAVGLLLRLFSDLPYHLVVVGDGRDATALRQVAPPNVTFIGELPDDELRGWYNRASVVVFPGEDDFGLVPLEAMACGTPVVALDAGGARETVAEGVTGLRFAPGHMAEAVRAGLERDWDHEAIAYHAAQFSNERFTTTIRQLVLDQAALP